MLKLCYCFKGLQSLFKCPSIAHLEPEECMDRKAALAAASPFISIPAGVDVFYFNNQVTLQIAQDICKSLRNRFATIDELNQLSPEIRAILKGCSISVWAIKKGKPVIAVVPPEGRVRTFRASPRCRAATLCVSKL